MKKIFVILTTLLLVLSSCAKQEQNLDIDEVTEALYVLVTETNRLSEMNEPNVCYFTYFGPYVQNRSDYTDEVLDAEDAFKRTLVIYKDKFFFEITTEFGRVILLPYQNLAPGYSTNTKEQNYLLNVVRNLNGNIYDLKQDGQTIYFGIDCFSFHLERVDGRLHILFKRLMDDGSDYVMSFSEEEILKHEIGASEAKIALITESLTMAQNSAENYRKLVTNAGYYQEYQKRLREHRQARGRIMQLYDRRPYDRIRKIIDENPEIMENTASYTKDNLATVKETLRQLVEEQLPDYEKKLAEEETLVDSLRAKLTSL